MSVQRVQSSQGFSDSGWLSQAKKIPSPNYDSRPASCRIEVVIIHAISLPPGQFGGQDIEHLFLNQLPADGDPCYKEIYKLKVSAHFLIRRTGDITQFVSIHDRAWHAGISSCRGRDQVNDFSIGIELEGTDQSSFTEFQYNCLQDLLRQIQKNYPYMDSNSLYGHSDIAPGRKTDPGPGFDWQRVRCMLAV